MQSAGPNPYQTVIQDEVRLTSFAKHEATSVDWPSTISPLSLRFN